MNLLFLHSSSDLYGASKILLAVTELSQKKGHTVTVVLSDSGPLADKLINSGIEVIYIPLGVLRRKYINPSGIINRLKTMTKAYASLKQVCRQKNIDLIYSNTTSVLVGNFVAGACRVRHIWHVHEIIEKPKLSYQIIGRLLNRNGNEVLVVSKAVKEHWRKYVDPAKITVLYNGVDHDIFANKLSGFRAELGITDDVVVIGMMGRVHYWKGQDYFLRIAGILNKEFPQLAFILVGDPFPGYEYIYQEMDKIIKEQGIIEQVYIIGYRDDIVNIFNAFDIFILPSQLPDPAPAVVTEAMAAGKPVVITEQGGAVEMVIAGESGILIPINDPEKAAEKIAPLIRDEVFRNKMGFNARQRILESFSREAFNTGIMRIIENTPPVGK